MNVTFLEAAQVEFEQATAYYNQESPGLGFEFADEVFRSIERVCLNPEAWQSLSNNTRRCITRRFPYGVVYQILPDQILILAIMHLHLHPDSWRDR